MAHNIETSLRGGYKYVYVVLHYNTIKDTIDCIDSIEQHTKKSNSEIVVVDNGSPNGSGEELKRLYAGNDSVHVILNGKNVGFAKGNNVGYLYAKESLKADFIVLLNNDTMLLRDDLQQSVIDEYEKSACGVIGPKIITPNPPYDSNPGTSVLPSLRKTLWAIVYYSAYLLLSYVNLDLAAVRRFDKSKQRRMIEAENNKEHPRRENVQLHGSFLIFTPTYVQLYDGLDPRTFMYGEEELLFLRCIRRGITTVYLPCIEVFHKEDSATNTLSFGKPVERRRFTYKNAIRSKLILALELLR